MPQVYIHPELKFIEVSNGSVGTFMNQCERKFFYPKILGVPRDIDEFETGAALVGQALHKAYQVYSTTHNFNAAVRTLLFSYPHHVIHQVNDKRNVFACIGTLEQLCSIQSSNDETFVINDKPATEVSFRLYVTDIEIDGRAIPVYYVGFIDRIVKDPNQVFRIIDLKTYSGYEYDIDTKHQFDYQLTGYHIAVSLFLNQNSTWHLTKPFSTEYIIAQINILDPEIDGKMFKRDMQHIKQWGAYLETFINRLQTALNEGPFMFNASQCKIYGRVCPHFSMCALGDGQKEHELFAYQNVKQLQTSRVPNPDIQIDRSLFNYV